MRLIDADELFKKIERKTVNCFYDFTIEDLNNIKNDIDEMPTFDIDKVVQELENEKYRILLEKAMDDVIEIVKRGGLNEIHN